MARTRRIPRLPSWKVLLEINRRWWEQRGSLSKEHPLSCYDRDEIIEENPSFAEVIVPLNGLVVTTQGQNAEFRSMTEGVYAGHLQQIDHHFDSPEGRSSMELFYSFQRLYIEFVIPSSKANSFLVAFGDHKELAVACHNNSSYEYVDGNPLMEQMFKFHRGVVPLTTSTVFCRDGKVFVYHGTTQKQHHGMCPGRPDKIVPYNDGFTYTGEDLSVITCVSRSYGGARGHYTDLPCVFNPHEYTKELLQEIIAVLAGMEGATSS